MLGSWGRSWSFSLGVYCVMIPWSLCGNAIVTGWSVDGPESMWTSFGIYWIPHCAIAFDGLERMYGSLYVTGMIVSLLMSSMLLYRSSLWDQDSGRSVSGLSLSHSRSMLLWSRSLVRYFFCAVFSSGQADLLEILSEKCSLIKCWIVIIQIEFSVKFILNLMDSVSLSFQHL